MANDPIYHFHFQKTWSLDHLSQLYCFHILGIEYHQLSIDIDSYFHHTTIGSQGCNLNLSSVQSQREREKDAANSTLTTNISHNRYPIIGLGHSSTTYVQQFIAEVLFDKTDGIHFQCYHYYGTNIQH